jgi:DNA-binding transcriptional ArsR family regulator
MDLEAWSSRLKVFADATRVRLLALLEGEELTVAELSAITQLAQPRVSTHLAKLKEAGMVRDRRAGVSAYYRFDDDALWTRRSAPCGSLQHRQRRSAAAPGRRTRAPRCWPCAPPTRTGPTAWPATWSATTRPGAPGKRWRAPRCPCWRPATCSTSPPATACWPNCWRRTRIATSASTPARVVAAAAERLRRFPNVEVREGDMHALPFKDASFDLVVLMHALTYAAKPAQAVAESRARAAQGWPPAAVQPGPHEHRNVVEAYGHVNLGFSEKELRKFAEKAGLRDRQPAKPSPASVARRISR